MTEQEKESSAGSSSQDILAAGYEYNTLMHLLKVSVSKHLLDEHFTLIWANEFYYDMIGWPKEEYEKAYHNRPDLYYQSDPSLWTELTETVLAALNAGEGGYQLVTRMRRRNGDFVWVQLSTQFAREYINGYQVAYSVMTNIDNLVKIQKEQSVTYESLPGFVAKYRIDPDMNLTLLSANARFMEYFGEAGESSPLYQRNIDVNMEIILKYGEEIRKGAPVHFVISVKARSGQNMYLQVNATCVDWQNGSPVYLAIFIDITDVTELLGKDVYVKPGTKYFERLKNLDVELGGGIRIHEADADTVTTEDLIGMVSQGEIPYTISDENIARLNKTYFWNLNVSLKISFMQRSSWVVRKSSPELAKAIDAWASDKAGTHVYKALTKRYFELSKQPVTTELPEVKNGHVSPYDELFRKHAKNIGWDWQLLASIGYQESRFNPNVVSWAGAEGLMGIMPNTAKALGVTPHELKNPDTGIRTGVDCLRRFRQGFGKITDPVEKIKFTLAAYNAGIGHIYDAQRLAEKYGKDPYVWDDNVAEYIRMKNDPEYYNDPVCKHGYLRGSETFNYVREVMERYNYYLHKTGKK